MPAPCWLVRPRAPCTQHYTQYRAPAASLSANVTRGYPKKEGDKGEKEGRLKDTFTPKVTTLFFPQPTISLAPLLDSTCAPCL